MPKQATVFDDRDERIAMEIIVDCYDEEEEMMGWYCYLHDTLEFPFKAEIIKHIASSPLNVGDMVEITQMADSDVCESDMLVEIKYNGKALAIPLKQIKPINATKITLQAIDDWNYWAI